ncbi:MAG: DUF3082 domain-containing protein [Cyanobacteria bacterium P01_H01_bin.15]
MTQQPPLPPRRSIWRYLSASLISLACAWVFYQLLTAIATSFANHPITDASYVVRNLTTVVRTLVLGLAAMGTGVFGLVGLGLFAYAIQVLLGPSDPRPTE